MLGVRSPQSIACGVVTSVSRIELYNSDRIVSLFMFLYGYCYCYSLMSTICMKLDPVMHIGMHLVCFSKTGCDSTWVCFDLDKKAEGRSLYLHDLKNRRVGITVGEVVVRVCDLRRECHPNSLTIWGRDCTTPLVIGPEASAAYQKFILHSESRKRDFEILYSLAPPKKN
jgi:hypothetical protein